LHPTHPYRPKKADLHDLETFERQLGASHVCLIAFSVYHTDNTSLIDALERLGGQGRGVACIDPDEVTDKELQRMHDVGIRGVRLNLRTRGQCLDRQAFDETLRKYADRIRPWGWCIQMYVAMEQIVSVAPVVPELGVPVVFDHLGSPSPDRPPRLQAGYSDLIDLLRRGLAWIKLSGTYRFRQMPELGEYIREILHAAPDQVVWASDWPHSGGVDANPGGDRTQVQEYRKIDDLAFVLRCKEWCNYDEDLMRKIWVDNPRRLWQYDGSD
jgi:predicted TIM-barrel fold metal-dependent hydrolase